nr:AsmA-like C-terminal region-containing protein [Azospirillum sp. SYSU D00513]
MTVELALDGAGGTLEAGGVLTELEEDAAADLKLRARHPDAARLAALLGGGAEAEAAGPLDVYGELSGTRRSLLLNNIQGLVAGTSLRGQAGASFDGERPAVEAELQADSIALDRLLAAPAAASGPASGAGAPAAAGSGAGGPLDLSWLRGFDGRFGLTAGALTLGENRVEDATLRAALADGALTLERFDGGLLGGRIGLTGRLAAPTADGAQLPAAAASITLSGAQFGSAGALPETLWWAAPVSSGQFDLEMALETRGASTGAMLQALSGEGRVAGRDGVLRGFDLAALRDRLAGRLERSQDALEAALRGFQGGETAFTRLDGSFTLERGVMRSEEMRVVTEAGDATASGQVDLPTRTVDIRLRVEAKAETELPPLTLRLTGPLDTPTRAFELREVQEFLARRAAAAKP